MPSDDEFIFACENGDINQVIKFLNDKNFDINNRDICYEWMVSPRTRENLTNLTLKKNSPRFITINLNSLREYGFQLACKNGHINIVELLLNIKHKGCDKYSDTLSGNINVHADNELAFRMACENGHNDIVKLLLSLTGDDYINVHVACDHAFLSACYTGKIQVIKTLLSLEGDRYFNVITNESGFRYACINGQIEIMKLLLTFAVRSPETLSLTDDRYINIYGPVEKYLIYACENRSVESINFLLKLKGNSKIYPSMVELDDDDRYFLFTVMIKNIYKKRKKILMERKVRKNKRLTVRELKSLPKNHLYNNFPGGYDYLKVIDKY